MLSGDSQYLNHLCLALQSARIMKARIMMKPRYIYIKKGTMCVRDFVLIIYIIY